MTLQDFKNSLDQSTPPVLQDIPLALWHDAKGDWEAAHNIAQNHEGIKSYDHLHAYLHRKEGDDFNASYWYGQASEQKPVCSLQTEWERLVVMFL